MANVFLKSKLVAFLAVLLCAFLVTVKVTKMATALVHQFGPVIEQEMQQFLPITFRNGEVAEPQNTVISKDYNFGPMIFKVVLDTRVNEFSADKLQNMGLYLSKKYFYGVSSNKTEMRSFPQNFNMTIDADLVHRGISTLGNARFIFFYVFISFLLYIFVAIAIYSLFMHIIMSLSFHTKFGQTLQISTLSYVVLVMLAFFAGIKFGVIINFLVILAANIAVASSQKSRF